MKAKNIITVILLCAILGGLSIYAYVKPQTKYSYAERRTLDTFPELSIKTLLSGDFMSEFENYTLDQFPFRDTFRGIKTFSEEYIFNKKDNNDIYNVDGYLSEMVYPLDYKMLDYASNKFKNIKDTYFPDSDSIYLTIVPDKNYFLAEKNGYLNVDYDKMFAYMQEKNDYMKYIDITPTLDINDYYRTDTHWKQEMLPQTAEMITETMGIDISNEYTEVQVEQPFYGVHCGHYGLQVKPDTISYLTNDIIDEFNVSIYNEFKEPVESTVYNMDKLNAEDPYDMFLSGVVGLITIENPNATTDKELVVFRDSFGASISPLLAQGYAKTTLIDLRMLNSVMLSDPDLQDSINFENSDILFMYSTIVLNTSTSLK
ncbi:MAG: hypothetical protein IKT46_05585 [Clostridia bacterium]|nr:hypothetical protein [Clostridia bacterium]